MRPVRNGRKRPHGGWRTFLATLPGVGIALLPKVACPACWPAYAGLLSVLGLGFLLDSAYLLPLTALFLAAAVAALGFRAPRRRGYGPFVLGVLAVALVVAGKFALAFSLATYGGVALLMAASVWNSWPGRVTRGPCPACPPEGPLLEIGIPQASPERRYQS